MDIREPAYSVARLCSHNWHVTLLPNGSHR